MRLMIKTDISPCIVKDPETNIGVVLVPGQMIDLDEIGITDQAGFVKSNRWAFESDVEDASAVPGRRRNTKLP